MAAPAAGVLAAWPATATSPGEANLVCFGGTSGATPQVAAGAAVLFSESNASGPLFTSPGAVAFTLTSTATPVPAAHNLVGAGLMNLNAAVTLAAQGAGPWGYTGKTFGGAVRDTAFAGNVAYYLMPDGNAVAPDPGFAQEFVPIAMTVAAPYDWITGDLQQDASGNDVLIGGSLSSAQVARVAIASGVASATAISLPSVPVAEAQVVSTETPDTRGAIIRRALIPLSSGIASVRLDDASGAVGSPLTGLMGIQAIAVSRESLSGQPSPSTKRLAVLVKDSMGIQTIHLMSYDAEADTATEVEDSVPVGTGLSALTVSNVSFGGTFPPSATASADGGSVFDPSDNPVWIGRFAGAQQVTGNIVGQTQATFFTAVTTFPVMESIVNPLLGVPQMYSLDAANIGLIHIQDSRDGSKVADLFFGNGAEPLSNMSISADGTIIIFKDEYGYIPNDPKEQTYYLALKGCIATGCH